MPVVGSLILFLSWVFQQSLLNEVNSTLQRMYTAQSVFQTYQSNNAIFNAIVESVKNDSESAEVIRRSQVYNYELGLRELEALLDDAEKSDIPRPARTFDGTIDVDAMMNVLQDRTEQIQVKIAVKRNYTLERKARLNAISLFIYALGSLMILIGSISNTMSSLGPGESPIKRKEQSPKTRKDWKKEKTE